MLPVKFHLQGQNFQLQINDLKIHHLWFDYFNDTPERFILVRFQQHQTATVIIRKKVQHRQIIRKILMDHLNHCIVEAVEDDDLDKIKEFGDAIQKFIK